MTPTRTDKTTSALLYLDGITVSFDGFKALNELSLRDRAGRDARHHRPQRRRQDHHDGRDHRQDAARRRRRVLRGGHLRPLQARRNADRRARHRPQVPEADRVRDAHGRGQSAAGAEERPPRARDAAVAELGARRQTRIDEILDTIRLAAAALARGRQPVARAEAVAGDRHAAGAGAETAAGRRAGRRHDRRRDHADRRAAEGDQPRPRPWSWSSTTWPSCASSASRSPACTKARCWRKAPSTRFGASELWA